MTGIDDLSDAAAFVLGWLAIITGLTFGLAALGVLL